MPGFNQTGPSGLGPMTGRGLGSCNTSRSVSRAGVPGTVGFGRGMRYGRGFRGGPGPWMRGYPGRGWGWKSAALPEAQSEYAEMELDRLKNQAESMQRTLDAINERIKEMDKSE